jgi:hypothetical protein
MADSITLKFSNISGKAPLSTDLVLGEMAVNTTDGSVYSKKDDSSIIKLKRKPVEIPNWRQEGPITGDSTFNSNSLLITFIGSNGATTFTDRSSFAHVLTTLGNSVIDGTFADPFGTLGGVGSFDGTGDYLTTPASTDLNFGTGAFTIEAWVYKTSYRGGGNTFDEIIYGSATNVGGTLGTAFFLDNATGSPSMFNGVIAIVGDTAMPLNRWNHVAWTYDGTTMRIFQNGSIVGQQAMTHNHTVSGTLRIGGNHQNDNTRYFLGKMSNLRSKKGIALYTSAFTVPSTAFPTNAPVTNGYTNKQIGLTSGWPTFKNALDDQITRVRNAGLATGTAINLNLTLPGTGAFNGGVLLQDGRVFCVPYNSTTARIYDPLTNTVTTPSGTYAGSAAFAGGVLLPDGRVYIIPSASTTARIYDPVTDTLTTPSGTFVASNFIGGVLLQDGRVFIAPGSSATARIYNPYTDTLITAGGSYLNAYNGAVLLPDGRVFLIPSISNTGRIYDPVNDTVTIPSGVNFSTPGTNNYAGGVLLSDGRVYCIPALNTTLAIIYDPVTNTSFAPSGTYPGTTSFAGGVLLPDGRVFIVMNSATAARIYDPFTDKLITPPGTYSAQAYARGVLLLDGRVFLVPYSTTVGVIVSTSNGIPIDPQIARSPFFNKY